MEKLNKAIEIMDTTLRDGEQTAGVSFMPHEKLAVARQLLQDVGVDRIEVASARVSEGERKAVAQICTWAESVGKLDSVEVLGFVDGQTSVDWIDSCGCKRMNLLCKGSERHCTFQLKKTVDEHITDIRKVIEYASIRGIRVNVYLEDWSNGMKDSPDYVMRMVEGLRGCGILRFMLPDTLGILNPVDTTKYITEMVSRFPDLHFDFHAHNDYDMAVSNAFAAVVSGVKGLHTAVNGLGERAGNVPLSSVQVIMKDHLGVQTNINENRLYKLSRTVESYSGLAVPGNRPVTGDNVFTQVAGVHADGDNKKGLYINALKPERFGRVREYALGKNSGKANVLMNLEALDIELSPEDTRKVTARIIELGDSKKIVTPDDLPYIIADVLKHNLPEERVKLISYFATSAYHLRPSVSLRIEIEGKQYESNATGDGQYDAFVRGLRDIYINKLGQTFPALVGYNVTIPPGGRTDAFVQTNITWNYCGREFKTTGFDADQMTAAIKATIKMLNTIAE